MSVDDLCRAAGVKKGSFYHYFPSKQDLALAALDDYFTTCIECDLKNIFAANIPFEDQINSLSEAILQEQRESLSRYGHVCGCPMATLGSELAGQAEEQAINRKVEDMFAHCRTVLQSAIERAVTEKIIPPCDAAQKSMEIHDFITGQMIMARIHNSLEGLERDLNAGMKRILGINIQTGAAAL